MLITKFFKNLKLRQKMLTLFFLTSGIAVTIAALFSLSYFLNIYKQNTIENTLDKLNYAEKIYFRKQNELEKSIYSFSLNNIFNSKLESINLNYIKNYFEQSLLLKNFSFIAILDINGKVIYSSDKKGLKYPKKEFLSKIVLEKILSVGIFSFITDDINFYDNNTKDISILSACPLIQLNKGVNGFIVAGKYLNKKENNLYDLIDEISKDLNIPVIVLDNKNNYVVSDNSNNITKNIFEFKKKLVANYMILEKKPYEASINSNSYIFIFNSLTDTNDKIIGYMGVGSPQINFIKIRTQAIFGFILIIILSIFISFILSLFFSDHITKPILSIVQGTKKISKGNFNIRITSDSSDEIGLLANEFNSMANKLEKTLNILNKEIIERRKAEKMVKEQNINLELAVLKKQKDMELLFNKMLQQEKLAMVGQMAGSLAHELRNPLGAVKTSIYYLKTLQLSNNLNSDNKKVSEHLNLIDDELNVSVELINSLLGMANIKTPQKKKSNLEDIIKDSIVHSGIPEYIDVSYTFTENPFMINVDPFQLKRVLINLLTNSAQAIKNRGHIKLKAFKNFKSNIDILEITDSGSGIKKRNEKKIFEPLFTTKAKGTGLGLSFCKQIIENHQGKIFLKKTSEKGSLIRIEIPF